MCPSLWVFSPAMRIQGRKLASYISSAWGAASVGFKRDALVQGPFCGQITVLCSPGSLFLSSSTFSLIIRLLVHPLALVFFGRHQDFS